jgi:hypothetical protein
VKPPVTFAHFDVLDILHVFRAIARLVMHPSLLAVLGAVICAVMVYRHVARRRA